jgi:hypothetical protein
VVTYTVFHHNFVANVQRKKFKSLPNGKNFKMKLQLNEMKRASMKERKRAQKSIAILHISIQHAPDIVCIAKIAQTLAVADYFASRAEFNFTICQKMGKKLRASQFI